MPSSTAITTNEQQRFLNLSESNDDDFKILVDFEHLDLNDATATNSISNTTPTTTTTSTASSSLPSTKLDNSKRMTISEQYNETAQWPKNENNQSEKTPATSAQDRTSQQRVLQSQTSPSIEPLYHRALTTTQSNPLPAQPMLHHLYPNSLSRTEDHPILPPSPQHPHYKSGTRRRSSTLSDESPATTHSGSTTIGATTSATIPNLGNLDPDEQAALTAEITARRAARRHSRQRYLQQQLNINTDVCLDGTTDDSTTEGGRSSFGNFRNRFDTFSTTRRSSSGLRLSMDSDEDDDGRTVKIGTRVSIGHRNYKLMYDMLTGIRIAVGRVSAKMPKELNEMDFFEEHKMGFDIMGNELTPGVKYDFKFKDYAPWVFRRLRENFHIDAADYLMTLTERYILSEINSPGKSGSFFYYSRDYRFIIKTIHHTEHKTIRRVLKDYYEHVCQNPDTLLCRYYGLHRIKLPHGRKIHFVVMGNVLPNDKVVHETYDLKGSTFGRMTPSELATKPGTILKDLNWVNNGRRLELGMQKRHLLMEQLRRDVDLLIQLNVMDYSLLVGIYDFSMGQTTGPSHLKVVSPQPNELQRTSSFRGRRDSSKADMIRHAIANASPVQLDPAELPETPSEERKYCKFYAEDGGFRSTDAKDKPTDKLYYFGIIDILTPYNYVKKSEHLLKSFTQNKTTISAVEPEEYGKRFLEFMETVVMEPVPDPKSKIGLKTI